MDKQKLIAAICASPALVLAPKGIVGNGVKATCYPADKLKHALGNDYVANQSVVVSGNVVTSAGPGTAIDFGLALIAALQGPAAAERIRHEVLA
jgi:4-methyl-5(b-hydroxyethyl)-thiazole monophosphate biosynthesis